MRERFDEYFEYMSGGYYASRMGRHAVHPDDIKHFIEQELKKERELKDQEHKAELEMIKGEIKEYFEGLIHVPNPQLTGNNIVSILDSHINKLTPPSPEDKEIK